MQTGCKLLCGEGFFLDIDSENSDMFAPGYVMRYDDISFLTSDTETEGKTVFDGDGDGFVEDITGGSWMEISEYEFTQEVVGEFGEISSRFSWAHRPKEGEAVFEEAQVRF